ncbi:T9SS type A sorting domain-containing protein [Flavobacterium humidisoli]|uniref:T9SS type A sorting domain-containing protein n=1 Tax=Flavobacterium humidisoli TaxID=2937442 RepID=A0ABY4LXQ3_9FLAO|nr:glycan-binding surface protein [Flavobacterium humidisoli]UPZ16465.1 T9SS type A sorting domain-containing protein [Flavobacterium humidisoli]
MRTKLLILCLLTVSFAKSQNLLQNGSFENFTDTTPNSWFFLTGATSQQSTIFSDGISSLDVSPVGFFPVQLPNAIFSQDFTVSDLETYTLKFDYFIPGTSLTNYISSLTFEISKNGNEAIFAPPPTPTNAITYGTWKTVTYDFKIAMFNSGYTSASLKLNYVVSIDQDLADHHIYFDNVSIVKKSTLGTVDFDKKANPIASMSKEEIRLNSDFKNSSYVIYSIDGKAVKRVNNNSSEIIGISGLPNGVYLLKLNDLGTSVKFIK